MSRATLHNDGAMKQTVVKLLQVSASYFAISREPAPRLEARREHLPLAANRFAAGAWPVNAHPLPAPKMRKVGGNNDGHSPGRAMAANDEKV